ncbi:MAG: sulfite exporter TauE/SafE family protein [Acidimicrobiales bacterium]
MPVRALLASPLGFLIGISLGALGGGGSVLAVPALVYVAGQAPKEAVTTSLVIVGATALVGMVSHLRAGNVRVGPGVAFGAAGVGGALIGSALNHLVDENVLLLGFAALMLLAAWRMGVNRSPADDPEQVESRTDGGPSDGGSPGPGGGVALAAPPRRRVDAGTVVRVLAAGSVVGLVTGFFGVGGGFVIVPALVLALKFDMAEAIGTSLLVIAMNSAVALLARLGTSGVDWGVALPFTVAGILGVSVGTRIGERVSTATLTKWFVGLLVALAAYLGGSSIVALVQA